MARNWNAVLGGIEHKLIAMSTNLKTRVELLVDGLPMECGEFRTTRQAGDWMAEKAKYWRAAHPTSQLRFVTK